MLKKCACGKYSLSEKCSCGAATKNPNPPKFSVKDRFGKYRRMVKQKDQTVVSE